MTKQPERLVTEAATARLEYYPGSSNVASLTKSHLDEVVALQDMTLEEDWLKAVDISIRCLGLGYGSFRLLMGERRVAAKRQANVKAVGEALSKSLHSFAQSEHWTEVIRSMHEKLDGIRPERPPEMEDTLKKLERGEITEDLPFLRGLIRPERGTGAPGRKMVEDITIMVLCRGLLGRTHAEFNRAFEAWSLKAESLLEMDLYSTFKTAVDGFCEALRAGQRDIFGTLLTDRSTGDRVGAAYSLAALIEERLPLFARAQACATLATQVLRGQGKGTAAEKLGGLAAQAGALTREAVASHAASYRMALSLLDPEPEEDVAQLLKKISTIAFDTAIPNGRNTELAKLAKVEDGDYIEVEGFATSINVDTTSDGKLISQVELIDPSSGATASAVAVYVHLLHLGVTEGAFCRVNGKYRKKSVLLGNRRAIEVDRLSLARLRKKCWRIAFLQASKRWFQCWPNGINMYWSLGPHRRAQTDDEVTYYGAAELIHTPLVRKEVS